LAVVAAVSFAVFLVWEFTDEHPVVDLRLFMGKNFFFGCLSLSLAYGIFFGNNVILPLWLQQWMGYTATSAGIALAPVGALAILLTPLVGKKLNVWDPRLMATGAFLLFAVVLWIRASFTTETDLGFILIPTILQGAALAFFFIPLTTVSLAGLGPERIPAAAGLSNFVRITAGAMGTSIATTVWDQRASLHHAHFTEPLVQGQGAFGAFVDAMSKTGLSAEQAWLQVNRMIDQQAFTRAADDIFYASAWGFIFLIAIIWIADRPAKYKPTPRADNASGNASENAAASAAH
jgi:DHA2 family multidrug resistance protein